MSLKAPSVTANIHQSMCKLLSKHSDHPHSQASGFYQPHDMMKPMKAKNDLKWTELPSLVFSKLCTDPTEYLLSRRWNVSLEMQLWLLSHVHQMEEACNSFRSWPTFLCFKTLWFISMCILEPFLISDEGFCSKTPHLCVNNETDSVKIPNAQMDFIIGNVTITVFTTSCYC